MCVEVSSLDDQSGDQFRALVSSSRGIPYRAFRGYGRGCGVEDGHAWKEEEEEDFQPDEEVVEGEEVDVEGELDASEVVAEDAAGEAGVGADAGEGDTGEEEAHADEGA